MLLYAIKSLNQPRYSYSVHRFRHKVRCCNRFRVCLLEIETEREREGRKKYTKSRRHIQFMNNSSINIFNEIIVIYSMVFSLLLNSMLLDSSRMSTQKIRKIANIQTIISNKTHDWIKCAALGFSQGKMSKWLYFPFCISDERRLKVLIAKLDANKMHRLSAFNSLKSKSGWLEG